MPRPLPRPNATPACYQTVVTIRGNSSTNGNPAIFTLPQAHGYGGHITIFAGSEPTPGNRPQFIQFHVTFTNPKSGARARYFFSELLGDGGRVAYEGPTFNADPHWNFLNPGDAELLVNLTINLATELANEINAKYRPGGNC